MEPKPTNPEPQDEWLTVTEFADQMRVRPVTVRSWITKGQLKATRSGQRKWLIRQSELARMRDGDYRPSGPIALTMERFEERLQSMQDYSQVAIYEWAVAVESSRFAPPDARFATRIRQIAQAASWRAEGVRRDRKGPRFRANPGQDLRGTTISYELRPGGNRPGPRDAWDRFDRIVARLGSALEGDSAKAVAKAFDDLASVLNEIADALDGNDPENRG
jgi:excisionase family DNA binding protein